MTLSIAVFACGRVGYEPEPEEPLTADPMRDASVVDQHTDDRPQPGEARSDVTTEDAPQNGLDAASDAIEAAEAETDAASPDGESEAGPPDGSDDGSPDTANDAPDEAADAEAGCSGDACVPCTSSAECTCAAYGGSIYWFCSNPSTWSAAEAACEGAGMRLARVVNASENAWIRSTGDALALAYMWLGAEDPTHTSNWQWPDGAVFWTGGSSGSPVGGLYSNWNAMHPNGSAIRACGGILSGQYTGEWDDRSCTSVLAYVCKAY